MDDLWKLIKPTTSTDFWTMMAAFGTFAVVYVARKGLKSLKFSKADIETRAMREALEISVMRSKEFAETIIPEQSRITSLFQASAGAVFITDPAEVDFESYDKNVLAKANEWFAKLPWEVRNEAVSFLNSLEAWSMYFTLGLADGDSTCAPCAPMFCSIVVLFYPVLIVHRVGPTTGGYPNIVQLFGAWLDKLETAKQGMTVADLLRRAQELQAKSVRRSAAPLRSPIGTRLDHEG